MPDGPISFTLTAQQGTNATEIITLREGDVLKISFPGAANLNTTQPIRRDGMISMPLIGEVKAAGKTPKELEKELIELYSTQLLSKEVTVEVQSSTFPVYVSGSVLHPGKIMSDHPMTAFEAIMEAGGFRLHEGELEEGGGDPAGEAAGTRIHPEPEAGDGGKGGRIVLPEARRHDVTVPEKFTWF